jgi:DNA-binding MarR family transcriptional regulator
LAPANPPAGVMDRPGYLLKRAQSALNAGMAGALREHGATLAQYAVLTALDEEPGLSNAGLARRAFVTPQTMNQVLLELEQKGWVTRHPHPGHARILQAELSETGRAALRACHRSADIVTYLTHSRVTEQRASEQMRALRRYSGGREDIARAVRVISNDEDGHLAYCHEELLRLAAAGHGKTIRRTLRATAIAEIAVYRDVSRAVMAHLGRTLGWSRPKAALLGAGIQAVYAFERLGGWRRMVTLRTPARLNALGTPAPAQAHRETTAPPQQQLLGESACPGQAILRPFTRRPPARDGLG